MLQALKYLVYSGSLSKGFIWRKTDPGPLRACAQWSKAIETYGRMC